MATVLTADSAKPAALRRGAIILARHGEPALSRKVRLTAQGYREFWARYEVLGIVPGQTPPDRLRRLAAECGTIVSSTRLRAIESTQALVGDRPFARHEVLIEAPLPPPDFPSWLRLSPRFWGFLSRVWWWFLNHHEGQETRAQAEARADRAADLLVELAADGGDVVVLAHGFFNHLIGRSLRRRGWKLAESEGYKYWSVRRFEPS
ncbi:MAG: histidine phosphatase family protein [Phenylobacterium sp.]|uniref:histidine phosphatase family protein n=1 Tax=Phenylobacterium sp. TaxID=1871053 RepID=UPI0025D18EB7|nr:histidine phosphatase family protein [Phenylobacterium sp.]MBI1199775.1 histidine phosphatase family protein [Phenylobacterium sp.]